MGVRAGVFVCVTSFLLGTLFTHWIADLLTLWKSPVTDEHIWVAALYYSIIARGPPWILYILAAIVLLGTTTILWSLNDFRAGNIMFDGGSIFLFSTTVVIYINSVLPSLYNFSTLSHDLKNPIPPSLRIAILDLASQNLILSVALTGVLALQAGRSWAERSEGDDDDDDDNDDNDYILVDTEEPTVEASAAPIVAPMQNTDSGSLKRTRSHPEVDISEETVKPLLQTRVQET